MVKRAAGKANKGNVGHVAPPRSAARHRVSVVWLLLAVMVVAATSVGACALLLPDRPPSLLSHAGEVTSAPVNVQQYSGAQQVTVVPTMSASRELVGNATGTVTGDWVNGQVSSGAKAYKVNDRVVVALYTDTPLYRDLNTGDTGDDVLALNNALNDLGYSSSPGSNAYTWLTSQGWGQLMTDSGNASDGNLLLADVLWIPEHTVSVTSWTAVSGTNIAAGSAVASIPGVITRLDVKGGQAATQDRTLSVYGHSITLSAGATMVDDATFCQQITESSEFQSMLTGTGTSSNGGGSGGGSTNGFNGAGLSTGLDASVSLVEPMQVLRVPAAAVFSVKDQQGCVVADGKPVKVSIIGSELGASLVRPQNSADVGSISTVGLGSAIASASCS